MEGLLGPNSRARIIGASKRTRTTLSHPLGHARSFLGPSFFATKPRWSIGSLSTPPAPAGSSLDNSALAKKPSPAVPSQQQCYHTSPETAFVGNRGKQILPQNLR